MGILDKWREMAMAANPNLKVRQEETNANAVPKSNLVAGALNAAFPRATAVLGGADEIKRRADIYDSGVPMAPPKPPVVASVQPTETPSQFPARPDSTMLPTAGVVPAGSPRGGFVGAATDAEAAKNLQDRLTQDEAAKSVATNMDRGTEALRNLRAEQMGITRNALDTAEGRTRGTTVLPSAPSPFSQPGDSFGDEVLRRDQLVRDINNPRASRTDRKAAADIYNSYIEAAKPVRGISPPTTNPVDLQRFLLDQQKFGWQQGLDKSRLNLDAAGIGAKVAGQNLEQSKYAAEQRANFLKDFIYPDEKAPQAELGALTWQLSQSTNGVVPPEIMANYIQKAAEANGVDWKNAPPKSLAELGKKAMELAKADYQ